ncbi:glycosyltransferase family 4 protein [Desulfolithobacter dissulfuricans]|nr:glycosyltransferase family 4 protein [Desulfolithobacter dissulfuricans]
MSKILFLVSEDWFFCSHWVPMALAALESGFEVTLVTRLSGKKRQIESMGVKVIPIDIDRSNLNPLKELGAITRLVRVFRKEQPDIVHLISLKLVMLGWFASLFAGTKNIVAALTGMGFLFSAENRGGFIRWMFKRLIVVIAARGRILVENPDDRNLLQKAGVPPERICLIRGAGVDLARFCPGPEPEGVPVVMLAARLLREKGVEEFVEAARLLEDQGVAARFVLVGDPDPANPGSVSNTDITAWTEQGIIEWWGKSNNMPETLVRASIVCLPSYREGLPKVLLEAMACGRPCVATDVPGCREAVKDGENGFLVPVRDPESLAEALKQLIDDAALRQKMGRRGREMAEKSFSQERVAAQVTTIYRQLLGRQAVTEQT